MVVFHQPTNVQTVAQPDVNFGEITKRLLITKLFSVLSVHARNKTRFATPLKMVSPCTLTKYTISIGPKPQRLVGGMATTLKKAHQLTRSKQRQKKKNQIKLDGVSQPYPQKKTIHSGDTLLFHKRDASGGTSYPQLRVVSFSTKKILLSTKLHTTNNSCVEFFYCRASENATSVCPQHNKEDIIRVCQEISCISVSSQSSYFLFQPSSSSPKLKARE